MPPPEELVSIEGRVTDVFAHRFVVETPAGRFLVDIGPKGAAQMTLSSGVSVALEGRRKPSEIKVTQISINGSNPILLKPAGKPGRKDAKAAKAGKAEEPDRAVQEAAGEPASTAGKGRKKHKSARKDGADKAEPAPADPAIALASVRDAGYSVASEVRRKSKHFEVLGLNGDGVHEEIHVAFDGQIRKVKPGRVDDPKWTSEPRD